MLKLGSVPTLAACGLLALMAGCHARFVQATIENNSGQLLRVVEVDYPGAGFGVSTLAAHAAYSYRFKAIGSGPLTLSYTDALGAAHTATGPEVKDGQGGSLVVTIGESGAVSWRPALSAR